MTITSVPSVLLREPQRFLYELKEGVGLQGKATALLGISFAFFGVYGAVMGASHSWMHALVTMIKLPLLFILTMAVCAPTLQILNLLFGAKHSVGQLVVLLLSALAATGTILVGFLPITAFFLMTNDSYAFFKLLNVAILAVSAFYGVKFLRVGMALLNQEASSEQARNRKSVLSAWIVLYAFVGSQLAWVARPFFGAPTEPFEIFRDERGNFFIDVAKAMQQLLGG
jgi:hypothetical protein